MMTEGAAFELARGGEWFAKAETALVEIAVLIHERDERCRNPDQFRRKLG